MLTSFERSCGVLARRDLASNSANGFNLWGVDMTRQEVDLKGKNAGAAECQLSPHQLQDLKKTIEAKHQDPVSVLFPISVFQVSMAIVTLRIPTPHGLEKGGA